MRPQEYTLIGRHLQDNNRRTEAIRHYKAAVALNPLRSEAHQTLGVAYHTAAELSAAAASYMQSIELAPASALLACYNLGALQASQSRTAEARALFEQALVISPGHAAATAALAALQGSA